jgi:aspartyl-tRNA(Asn)/glutamyl-tRNA(Gln) amidotransferase subunit A
MNPGKVHVTDAPGAPAGGPAFTTKDRQVSMRAGLCTLGAGEIARLVREREASPVEIVEAFLSRQADLEPHLGAFCTPTPELARAAARKLEAEIAAKRPIGPLSGVPVAIKDLIATKGIRTTGGARAYADFVPGEDDVVVERLLAAGAIILGKTNVAELGYGAVGHNPVFPTTRNPWALDRTSGGSSAGSAVAVAAGMAPIALGTDGGGSIRIPAALCGVVGFKPSMGRVPLYPGCRDERFPGFSSWESIEHIGPIARTVADIALVMSVIAGPDPRDRHSIPVADVDWLASVSGGLRGLRVAFTPDWGYAAVDPEVREIAACAARTFQRQLGCELEEAAPGFTDSAASFDALVALETDLTGMRRFLQADHLLLSPSLAAMVERSWTATEFTDAIVERKRVANTVWRFMQRYDLLLTPTVAVPAFDLEIAGPPSIDGRDVPPQGWTPFTYIMNLTGQPAISVPAGWTRAGLPIGLQICGPHLGDGIVLRAAAAYEAVAPWADRWPPFAYDPLRGSAPSNAASRL